MTESNLSQDEEFPTVELVERTEIKRARETESALDSLRKLQSSPWLGRHRGAGPRVSLPQQSGSSNSHLKCPKWEISAFSPVSEQSLSPDSSFLLKCTNSQPCQSTSKFVSCRLGPAVEPSCPPVPGGRTSGTARWHVWLARHPGTRRLRLRSAGAVGNTGTGRWCWVSSSGERLSLADGRTSAEDQP